MADVRPVSGLRYTAQADLAALVTPPYDVISPEAQDRYYERHPENIIRLQLGREGATDTDLDDRYTRAATTFADWPLPDLPPHAPPPLHAHTPRRPVSAPT